MRPGFVVFDEPTCGLDQEGVGRFVGLGRALRRMNTGVVVISHDGDVLRALVDRLLYLVGDGSWEELPADALAEKARFTGVVNPSNGR